MGETRDTERVWDLIGPWVVPSLGGVLMSLVLTVVTALGPLRDARVMLPPLEAGAWLPLSEPVRSVAMAAGGTYWVLGVALAIAPAFLRRRLLGGRARAADLLQRLAAGFLLFVVPMLSAMLILTAKMDVLEAGMRSAYVSDVLSLVTLTVYLPLVSVNLAAAAWLTRPAPAALRVGGVSLCFLAVTMAAHHGPFTDAGRDQEVAEERDATGPMCSSERTRLTPNRDRTSPTGIYIPWEFVTYGWWRWRRM